MKKQIIKIEDADNKGFTLVEMLVSVAVFLLTMAAVLQLFFYANRAYRILMAHANLIGEMSYNLEHISRGLRMAKKVQLDNLICGIPAGTNYQSTSTDGGGIKFQIINDDGSLNCVEYYRSTAQSGYGGKGALMERQSNPYPMTSATDLPLTSPATDVEKFAIVISGASQVDDLQPRVTLLLRTKGTEDRIAESQITVSMRDIDVTE
jgi:prepilin-type N-terminal cleavage/methylation domain-containing protein